MGWGSDYWGVCFLTMIRRREGGRKGCKSSQRISCSDCWVSFSLSGGAFPSPPCLHQT